MPTHVDESYLDALFGPSILFLACFILLEIHKTWSSVKVGYFHTQTPLLLKLYIFVNLQDLGLNQVFILTSSSQNGAWAVTWVFGVGLQGVGKRGFADPCVSNEEHDSVVDVGCNS